MASHTCAGYMFLVHGHGCCVVRAAGIFLPLATGMLISTLVLLTGCFWGEKLVLCPNIDSAVWLITK